MQVAPIEIGGALVAHDGGIFFRRSRGCGGHGLRLGGLVCRNIRKPAPGDTGNGKEGGAAGQPDDDGFLHGLFPRGACYWEKMGRTPVRPALRGGDQ